MLLGEFNTIVDGFVLKRNNSSEYRMIKLMLVRRKYGAFFSLIWYALHRKSCVQSHMYNNEQTEKESRQKD